MDHLKKTERLSRYTFPRAMTALAKDAYARSALVTMACALAAAGVPKRFGGLFGEEWTTPAFQLLPPPGHCLPLHL